MTYYRRNNFQGGGCVLILKRKMFKCKSKNITELAEDNIFEVCMVEFDVVREMFYCWDFIDLQLQKTVIYFKKP